MGFRRTIILIQRDSVKVEGMKIHNVLLFAIALLAAAALPAARQPPPPSVIAASVGDSVFLMDPSTGQTIGFDTGPVGWLFPAPGGVLFAPNVIDGVTTVINLRTLQVVDRLDGLTMPYFGETPDRYIALAGEVMMVTYPERAVMAIIPAVIAHPWQAIVAPDDAAMLILERLPDGSTGIHMTTINLITRQVIYQQPLAGDIIHMALSPQLGLLALADSENNRVHLVEPATLTPMVDFVTPGAPRDVVFAADGKTLAIAVETADGGGVLHLGLYKSGKKGLRLHKEFSIGLTGGPIRIDRSPGGNLIAVALDNGSVQIVDVKEKAVVAVIELPGVPRDLRWCDPTREGPMIPQWTDGETPAEFGTFVPKVRGDGELSGLEEPVRKRPPN